MLYELVIFDLGGVVVKMDVRDMIQRIAQEIERPFADVEGILTDPTLLVPFELGKIKPLDFYTVVKDRLRVEWTYEEFVTRWNGIFRENTDVTWIMQRLRKRHRLMALSNTNELHFEYIRNTFAALSIVEFWVASYEVGMRKPDLELYTHALRQADVSPKTTVYIDDVAEHVEAGKRLGMVSLLFETAQQLEQELRVLGINV